MPTPSSLVSLPPEVIDIVVGLISARRPIKKAIRDLLCLSVTCRVLSSPALDFLWADHQHSLVTLLDTFASPPWVRLQKSGVSCQHIVIFGSPIHASLDAFW